MTLIHHYVYSISQLVPGFVTVIFKEMVSTKIAADYIQQAIQDWKTQGLPGEPPKHVLDHIRQQRFQNQFEMKFLIHEWNKRKLSIGDEVKINMPLQLDDVITVEPEMGV